VQSTLKTVIPPTSATPLVDKVDDVVLTLAKDASTLCIEASVLMEVTPSKDSRAQKRKTDATDCKAHVIAALTIVVSSDAEDQLTWSSFTDKGKSASLQKDGTIIDSPLMLTDRVDDGHPLSPAHKARKSKRPHKKKEVDN